MENLSNDTLNSLTTDLTILHLSDLHFNTTGAQPLKLYDALIKDIEQQLFYSQNIIIIVTGDIVDRGDYTAKKLVKHFFEKLNTSLEKIGKKVEEIYFVPGNHDKSLDYPTKALCQMPGPFDKQFFKSFGGYFNKAFKEYKQLTEEIHQIFFKAENSIETFGCNELNINGQQYIFVRFNTAWSANGGDGDRRNLKLGDFQLQELEKQYKEIRLNARELGNNPVVIAMAHHPLNHLEGKDEDAVQNFLIGQRGIDAQLFLCGHTHTRDVVNWSNNRQSLTTLSTGIGWPDESLSDHSQLHAYSIYVLRLDLNSIDVYVRSTNDGGTFVEDYRLYTREENRKHNKIVLPLSQTTVHSYFELGTVNGRSPKVLFLSNNFIKNTEHFIESLGIYRQMAIQEMHFRKGKKKKREIDDTSLFFSFMQVLCDGFIVNFINKPPETSQPNIRSHFRCICPSPNKNEIKYLRMCASLWPEQAAGTDVGVKEFPYSELIKAAFEAKHPLIHSINPEEYKISTDWKDFITAIPLFDENLYNYSVDDSNIQKYPIITFGVSIKSDEYKSFLYCLDYYRIDRVIASILQLYIRQMNFDLTKFANNFKEILKDGIN